MRRRRQKNFKKLSRAVVGKSRVDDEVLDNLEEVLITSDVGVETTLRIIERIETRVSKDKFLNASELNTILKRELKKRSATNTILSLNLNIQFLLRH